MKIAIRTGALAVLLATAATSQQAQAAPFDQQFIDSMVPHHQSALMMAQMAVTKAPHAEVKTLARNIVRDQQKEISQMKAWRKSWFGSANVPMDMGGMNQGSHGSMGSMDHGSMNHSSSGMKMTMKDGVMTMPSEMMGLPMKMKMDMGKLMRLKGRAFEKEFLRMMIPHHAGAIPMAQEALDTTARPQLRTLAHNIIDSQAKEIGDMRAIHRRYYGSL
jgi:uncharacterized protein (DUF305 family)